MLSSLQLEALVAVCDAGSFEQAAHALHITPSALSQRIAGLERATGRVLVRRSRPVEPTTHGHTVLGLARRTVLLHSQTLAQLNPAASEPPLTRVSLAINADSLSTWFQPVIAAIAQEGSWLLDIHIEDQDHTAQLLADGQVMTAVSTSAKAAPGCAVERLGTMRYIPAAAPQLLEREQDLTRLPMLRFDARDDLQHAYLRQINADMTPPIHYLPSNHEFLIAALLGLGWGVLPEGQIAEHLQAGRLIRLGPDAHVDVQLFWQRWRTESPVLDALSSLALHAATTSLIPPE